MAAIMSFRCAKGPPRMRVCATCVAAGDDSLGAVHSELECERCGARPCAGAIVVPARPACGTQDVAAA